MINIKILILVLIFSLITACSDNKAPVEKVDENVQTEKEKEEGEKKEPERNIFEGLNENSFGKFEGTILEVEEGYIRWQSDNEDTYDLLMDDVEILDLEDGSFPENHTFLAGDKLIFFMNTSTPLLNSDPPKLTPYLVALPSKGKFMVDIDKFHKVENFFLSTNNRLKIRIRAELSVPFAWNTDGNPYTEEDELKNFMVIYDSLEESLPPIANALLVVALPDDTTPVKFGSGFSEFSKACVNANKDNNLFANPRTFEGKKYQYYSISEFFEKAGGEVAFDDKKSEITVKYNGKTFLIYPTVKVLINENLESHLLPSVVVEYGVYYFPRELYEMILN